MAGPLVGDPAPDFVARSSANPMFKFNSVAGRWLVLTFVASLSDPRAASVVKALASDTELLDDRRASLFVVTPDPEDESAGRVPLRTPGVRAFWDANGAIAALFGAERGQSGIFTVILSPRLQVVGLVGHEDAAQHVAVVLRTLANAPHPDNLPPMLAHAPVMIIPNVFEPELCRHLIEGYEKNGGVESGFMREVGGRTVEVKDANHKVRRDWTLDDQDLIGAIQQRFLRRVLPEIKKAYQFQATRMERYLVACYAAEEGGHFNAHRDNTTKGTAHRRFAVSLNLNATEYDGGDLRLPEFGTRTYRAPTGGALVFSCSLLHEATRVTRGKRYAFLPFIYDEAAKKIRDENLKYIGEAAA